MSHGARVIRTGVSSAGPSAPPGSTVASSSAGSDAELMDGAYFRSCAGILKVAQMVRDERDGGRPLGPFGPLGPSACAGVVLFRAGRSLWRWRWLWLWLWLWGCPSGEAGVAVRCCVGRGSFCLSLLAGRKEIQAPLAKRSVTVCQKPPLRLPKAATRPFKPM